MGRYETTVEIATTITTTTMAVIRKNNKEHIYLNILEAFCTIKLTEGPLHDTVGLKFRLKIIGKAICM